MMRQNLFIQLLNFIEVTQIVQAWVADLDGVDPYPTFKTNSRPDPAVKKQSDPNPNS